MMLDKLTAIEDKYHLLEEQLSDPAIISDLSRFKKVNKEYKDLKEIIASFKVYKQILSGIETAREMIADPDPEMQEMGQSEIEGLEQEKTRKEDQLRLMLIPKDPEDSKDVLFEIRSGTGGDEGGIGVDGQGLGIVTGRVGTGGRIQTDGVEDVGHGLGIGRTAGGDRDIAAIGGGQGQHAGRLVGGRAHTGLVGDRVDRRHGVVRLLHSGRSRGD